MTTIRRRSALKVPWKTCRYIALDLETTGMDLANDSIISVGLVPIINGRVISAEAQYGLVRPPRPPTPASIQIHSLRQADLQDAPSLADTMHRVADLLSGCVLVAHAAWVEEAFLRRGLQSIGRKRRDMPPVIDTAALARAAGVAPRNSAGEPDLEWLCSRLGLPVMDPHHALGDAVTTGGLFIALASKLDAAGEHTARALLDLSECNSGR